MAEPSTLHPDRAERLERAVKAGMRLRKACEELVPDGPAFSVRREAVEAYDATIKELTDAAEAESKAAAPKRRVRNKA